MLLMCILRDGPTRPGELARRAGGISQKMLTQTLRELERHGIVPGTTTARFRRAWNTALTPLGESLAGLVRQIESWVESNYTRLSRAARSYDSNAAP